MKVLSLFDGMSCGAIALKTLDIPITRYVAYEIDAHAKKVSAHNFPDIEQRGDVFEADFTEFEGFDMLCGGSPCTHWSIAQSPDKRETTAEGIGWELFSQYTRALAECKPQFFIYENNKSMSKDIRKSIDEAFGFEAVLINSALVSAQNRNRLYWVGKRNDDGTYSKVHIEQPEDRGILLKDILDGAEPVCTNGGKSQTLKANYGKTGAQNGIVGGRTFGTSMAAVPVCVNAQTGARYGKRPQPSVHDRIYSVEGKNPAIHTAHQPSVAVRVGDVPSAEGVISGSQANRVYSILGKSVNLVANGGGGGAKTGLYAISVENGVETKEKAYEVSNGLITIEIKCEPRQYPIKLADGYYVIRKLTISECARLQQVPEWYDFSVISKTQAYKCLGNGWSVDVIAHLIKGLKK